MAAFNSELVGVCIILGVTVVIMLLITVDFWLGDRLEKRNNQP